MSTPAANRLTAIAIAVIWVCGALWAVDSQMRESDQAALLKGSLLLARDPGGWIGNDSYNYGKQYGSYWVVAGALRLAGGTEGGLERTVHLGNQVAVFLFSAGLLVMVASQRRWRRWTVALLVCVLFSPVVAFTGILLSANVLSAAFLFFLIAVLRLRGPAATVGVVLLAGAATAARQDAALLMPLLALLAIPHHSLREFLRSPRFWALAGGSFVAIVIGILIAGERKPLPSPFFSLPTVGAYVVGGLGGLLIAVLAFVGNLARSRKWGMTGIALAVLLPFVFYIQFLYTPRHFFITAVAVAATLVLPRGLEAWSVVIATRLGRVLIMVALAGTLVPWVVGVRMTGWTKGRLVTNSSTLFPTTDGFWPLGAYGSFYWRLANASRRPVDHNQEAWAAWSDPELALPSGKGVVISSGLISYGSLAMAYHRKEEVEERSEADYVVFDDRTLAKRPLGVNRLDLPASRVAQELILNGGSEVVGRGMGRNIVVWTGLGSERRHDDAVSLRLALSTIYRGNDFRLALWKDAWWRDFPRVGHVMVAAARSEVTMQNLTESIGAGDRIFALESVYDNRPWWVLVIRPKAMKELEELRPEVRDHLWISCSSLAKFMDVEEYSK